MARAEHHPGWRERHSEPAALAGNAPPHTNHGASAEDEDRTRMLCLAQTNRRAGIRDHQVSNGFSAALFTQTEQGQRGVAAALSRVKFETHGRIAAAVEKLTAKRLLSSQQCFNCLKNSAPSAYLLAC